jgi:anaerobic magnesium-protoporphyrin IX monomethyl ester cyclase
MHLLNQSQILSILKNESYDAVGFGGISTSYWYVKRLAHLIRERIPELHLVAGGVLSSAWKLLLTHSPIDVVCFGEGETVGVEVFQRLATSGRDFDGIKSIAVRMNGNVTRTPMRDYIENLDDLPFPDYSLLKIEEYLLDPMQDLVFRTSASASNLYRPGMKLLNIKTARGCTNRCAFCYRHFTGHRQHSVEYVVDHMKYVQDRFNVHFVRFGDELFTRDPQWVEAFCDALEKENMNIRFMILGVRTDTVSKKLLQRLVDVGCVGAGFGFESGSQIILDEMQKNTSVAENIEAIKLANEVKLTTSVYIVLGMPSETETTVKETADALVKAEVRAECVGINFAQAYPGTWLYYWARNHGFITDEDKYLDLLGQTTDYSLNFTKVPTPMTRSWRWGVIKALLEAEWRRSGKIVDYMKSLNYYLYSVITNYQQQGWKGPALSVLRKLGFKRL